MGVIFKVVGIGSLRLVCVNERVCARSVYDVSLHII